MTTIINKRRVNLLGVAIAFALLPAMGVAQEVDHSKMHHPAPAKAPAKAKPPAPKKKKVAAKKSATPAARPVAKPAVKRAAADPHAGHRMPAATPPDAQVEVDHAAMGHGPAAQEPVDHSTMDHSAMGHDMPAPKPGQAVDHSTMDHSAMGHEMPVAPEQPVDHSTMDHSTMDHSAMGHEMPVAPTEPLTPIPEITDADRAAAMPPPHDHPVHDNGIFSYVLFNRLEAWDADPGTGMQWEAQSWIGTDLNRVWLRSEGERVDGHTESADLEVLYGRSITPWWDVVGGVRHDFKPGRSQDFLALGVIGLAPYMFEVEATAYLGESGRTEASVEVEYEMLLTNRLILQPLLEVNVFGQTDESRGFGTGLGTAEAGLRLRYEVNRQFAPYIGVVRERAFGRTAELRRNEGEDTDDTRIVAGIRIWF